MLPMPDTAAPTRIPAQPGVAEFDALQAEPERWIGLVAALAARYTQATAVPAGDGTVLVALLGDSLVFKLYPPFLRDHFEFERALLGHLPATLAVPTPRLVDSAEHAGWPYLVMTQLPGTPLDRLWPGLRPAERQNVLHTIGRLAAQVHALPLGPLAALAPRWPDFLQAQRARCPGRQQRTGLPAHLLAQVESFVQGPVPAGLDVILTGEYTPFNLLYRPEGPQPGLCGMFDFGDGLVGPRAYDWLGPLCFLAAGQAASVDAYFDGYRGRALDRSAGGEREGLMRLLLLHRYSHLKMQLAGVTWQDARDFTDLAARIWP